MIETANPGAAVPQPAPTQVPEESDVNLHQPADKQEASTEEQALVKELCKWCDDTRKFWEPVHQRIDEEIKFQGGEQWPDMTIKDERYIANVTRRLVNQKVAQTYAKNPKAISRVKPKIDFVLWDGEQASLEAARMATIDPSVQQAAAQGNPQAIEAFTKANAILADYQNGMTHRQMLKRWGRTLELVYDHQCHQQFPSFKSSMKTLVRRALTARVGWVKLGYRRQGEACNSTSIQANTPELMRSIAQRLNEIAEAEGGIEQQQAKQEVAHMLETLQQGAQTGAAKLVDEGLVFDFPKAKSILVDKHCTNLKNFAGARRIAQQFLLTPEEVERRYGVEVEGQCTPYNSTGLRDENRAATWDKTWPEQAQCCVWEVYDIETQLRYTICDGYPAFLEQPAAPEPAVSRFWPIFALTFNDIEVEENDPKHDITCFAPSDVRLMMPMQRELNRSREALRDHRIQNRVLYTADPRLTENDRKKLASGYPSGECITIEGLPAGTKPSDAIAVVPKAPIDPAVYQTQHVEVDILATVGAQQANLGPTTGATATETSVAEGSRIQSGSSDVDDLDEFLTDLYRAGGEMLLAAMEKETVQKIVGPGACWPTLPIDIHNSELYLEAEASGSGRPNRAAEVSNMQMLLPLLMQLPGINPESLVKEVLRRWDDRLELEDFYQKDLPSIMAMNSAPVLNPQQTAAGMVPPGQVGAQPTQPGMMPPTANDPATQSPGQQQMPAKFANQTAATAAQPQPR